MTSAFISYSRHDQAVANYIAAQLSIRSVDVFIDYQNLQAGDFVSQLGRKIEQCEYFIVVISPRSVESKWVQAEIGWAFTKKDNRYIIPIWLEAASLTSVFVLAQLERVDFTRWRDDQNMEDATHKLCRLMNLPVHPIEHRRRVEPTPTETPTAASEHAVDSRDKGKLPPNFARQDVSSMFDTALSVEEEYPERALYLYERVLENDSEFMDGQIERFVRDKRQELKPARLALLQDQIELARKSGHWTEVIQLSKSMKDLDPINEFASDQMEVAEQNSQFEPMYKRAKRTAEDGNGEAAINLMKYVFRNAPKYRDPDGVLVGRSISRDLVGYLRNTQVLVGHNNSINDISFCPSQDILATASNDHTVRVWCASSGKLIKTLTKHNGPVRSVAFSPDSAFIASASIDGTVCLWAAESLEPIASADAGQRVYAITFSLDSKQLLCARAFATVVIYDLPGAAYSDSVRTRDDLRLGETDVTGLAIGSDNVLYMGIRENRRSPSVARSKSYSDYSMAFINLSCSDSKAISLVQEDLDYSVCRMRISPDGRYLVSVGEGVVELWELPQCSRYWSYYISSALGSSRHGAATFLPDESSTLVCSLGDDTPGELHFLDIVDKELVHRLDAHDDVINCIALSADGRYMATGSEDRTVKIWQL